MRAPTVAAARAFGVNDRRLRPLPGGQQTAWSDRRLVLKPVGCVAEHSWVCEIYAGWSASDVVRVPQPVRSSWDGAWVVEGWAAHVLVPGRDADPTSELDQIRDACDAFHLCVATLERPAFLAERDDPWSFGDRVAWEGVEPQGDPLTLDLIARLRAALRPVHAPDQVIHGDILPNVLLDEGLPPAVIDWPPYFRPAALATAIAATDAVTFRDAPTTLFDDWAVDEDWDQLLVRALLYRLGTTGWFAARNRLRGSLSTHTHHAARVVDAVLARAAS